MNLHINISLGTILNFIVERRFRTFVLGLSLVSLVNCSDDEDDPLSAIRPSTPEYAVGVVKNENVELKFAFTETWPGKNNIRIDVSEDTVTYILTVYYDSLEKSDNYFNLDFSWNEKTREIHGAWVYFRHNMDGIRYTIRQSSVQLSPHFPGQWYTVVSSAEAELAILRFRHNREKRFLSLDFVARIDLQKSDLEFETTITGAIQVNYKDYP